MHAATDQKPEVGKPGNKVICTHAMTLHCLFCHVLVCANDVGLHFLVPPLAQCCFFGASCFSFVSSQATLRFYLTAVKKLHSCEIKSFETVNQPLQGFFFQIWEVGFRGGHIFGDYSNI